MTPVTDLPLESAVNDDEILDKSNELSKSVCLPGCLLAQTLLKYTVAKPKRLTASICAQPDDQLHAWAQHAMLSRVLEALLQSTSVSFKHKSRLISSFQVCSAFLRSKCIEYQKLLISWGPMQLTSVLQPPALHWCALFLFPTQQYRLTQTKQARCSTRLVTI